MTNNKTEIEIYHERREKLASELASYFSTKNHLKSALVLIGVFNTYRWHHPYNKTYSMPKIKLLEKFIDEEMVEYLDKNDVDLRSSIKSNILASLEKLKEAGYIKEKGWFSEIEIFPTKTLEAKLWECLK